MTTTRTEAPTGDTRAPRPIEEIEIMRKAANTPATNTPATNTPATKTPAADTTPETPAQTDTPATETPAPAGPALKIDKLVIPVWAADEHASLVAAYTAADAGLKTKIRNAIKAEMDLAVRAMDITTAKIYMDAGDAIKSVSTKTTEKVDYNRVVANRVHALRIAADLIMSGEATPDGIPTNEMDLDAVVAMIEADNTPPSGAATATYDESIMEAGRKIAGTKITKSVARDDIADKISAAVAAVPVGTFLTVAMIQKTSGAASGGAIAARLWPTDHKTKTAKPTTLDLTAMGIKLDTRNSVRGVTKIADQAADTE